MKARESDVAARPRIVAKPERMLPDQAGDIPSFIRREVAANIDWGTVEAFGDEWERFQETPAADLESIAADYFDIVPNEVLGPGTCALDVGCGTGRWTLHLARRVGHVDGVEPSTAVHVARRNLKNMPNVRVVSADIGSIPFEPGQYDLVCCLGVLHHVPDTRAALVDCVAYLRSGGVFLVYLYYDLEGRGPVYRAVFHASNVLRRCICRLPLRPRAIVTDAIAGLIYFPLARISFLLAKIGVGGRIRTSIPLAYYGDKSFFVMRNDARDRFGTPLERRFSKADIEAMMREAGLTDIRFSERAPFWHAVGVRASSI
jgi:SAM-dependent methyltransferase